MEPFVGEKQNDWRGKHRCAFATSFIAGGSGAHESIGVKSDRPTPRLKPTMRFECDREGKWESVYLMMSDLTLDQRDVVKPPPPPSFTSYV